MFSPTTNEVLSADRDRFVPLRKSGFSDAGGVLDRLALNERATSPEQEFYMGADVDVLFSNYDSARDYALKALCERGESPASCPLIVLAATYDGEKKCYVAFSSAAKKGL